MSFCQAQALGSTETGIVQQQTYHYLIMLAYPSFVYPSFILRPSYVLKRSVNRYTNSYGYGLTKAGSTKEVPLPKQSNRDLKNGETGLHLGSDLPYIVRKKHLQMLLKVKDIIVFETVRPTLQGYPKNICLNKSKSNVNTFWAGEYSQLTNKRPKRLECMAGMHFNICRMLIYQY